MPSHPHRRLCSIAAISVAVLVAGGQARAQSAEAEQLFSDGTKLMADGKLAQACDAFAASNRVEARAGTLIQLGDCRERNHQLASAWSAYKDALGRVKDPRKRAYATGKIAALEPRMSYVTVQVADDNRIDGLTITRDGKPFDAALWNRALPLDGGDYVLVARAPGRVDWKTTAHVPVDGGKLAIQVPKLSASPVVATRPPPVTRPPAVATRPPVVETRPPPVVPAPVAPVAAPPPSPSPIVTAGPDPMPPPQGTFTKTRKLAVGLAAASVVSLAAGIALGVTATGKKDDAFKLCPDEHRPCGSADRANNLLSSSHTWATAANVGFGLALASGVAAGILWFTGAPHREAPARVSVVPSVTPDSVGLIGSVAW